MTANHLPPHFLRFAYRRLLARGYAAADLLEAVGLRAEDLEDESYRLSLETHERFVLNALELTGDPHLGIELAGDFEVLDGGVTMLAALNSGSIAKALQLSVRYGPVYTRAVEVETIDLDTAHELVLATELRDERVAWFGLGGFVCVLHKLFQSLLGGEPLIRAFEVALPEPGAPDQLMQKLPFPITFGHDATRVLLDPTLIDRETRQADRRSVRQLLAASERRLAEVEAENEAPLVRDLRALILEHLSAPLGLDACAAELGHSARGLRRKLAAESTSYQRLLDAVRLDEARTLLRQTSVPIHQISERLGFESPSHFGRAFKRWTGHAPSQERPKT